MSEFHPVHSVCEQYDLLAGCGNMVALQKSLSQRTRQSNSDVLQVTSAPGSNEQLKFNGVCTPCPDSAQSSAQDIAVAEPIPSIVAPKLVEPLGRYVNTEPELTTTSRRNSLRNADNGCRLYSGYNSPSTSAHQSLIANADNNEQQSSNSGATLKPPSLVNSLTSCDVMVSVGFSISSLVCYTNNRRR